MKAFQLIFFHLMTFLAGGTCLINLGHLIPGAGVGYEASWYKVVAAIVIAIFTAAATHAERSYKPFRHHRG